MVAYHRFGDTFGFPFLRSSKNNSEISWSKPPRLAVAPQHQICWLFEWLAGAVLNKKNAAVPKEGGRLPDDFLLTPELYNLVTYGHRSTPMETPEFYTNIAPKGMFSRSAPKKWALYVLTHGIFFGVFEVDACFWTLASWVGF